MIDLAKVMPDRFRQGLIGPCPDNAATCASLSCPASCAVGGLCRSGTCYCDLMFTGADCSNKLTPSGNYTKYVPPPPGATVDDSSAQTVTGYLRLQVRADAVPAGRWGRGALRLSSVGMGQASSQRAGGWLPGS